MYPKSKEGSIESHMTDIQKIDEFRKRTNSSYNDARYFLEKNNGELLDAIIDFENTINNSHKPRSRASGRRQAFGDGFIRFLQRLFDIRIVSMDRTGGMFSIPIILPILLIPCIHILIILAIIMVLLGYRFEIRDMKDTAINVQGTIDKIKHEFEIRK